MVVFAHGRRRRSPKHQKDHQITVVEVNCLCMFGSKSEARKSSGGIDFQAFRSGFRESGSRFPRIIRKPEHFGWISMDSEGSKELDSELLILHSLSPRPPKII